ncbi:MAG TPA: class IV adenylate cyclase [Spirochaetota bacterium]
MSILEIELKAPVSGADEIREKILSIGGIFQKVQQETDYYYNHPSRDFAVTGEAFRIRVENGVSRLTYKGPKLGGIAKTRVERETDIGDSDIMKEILNSLGFVSSGVVSKKREYFALDDATVTIDMVADLGVYVEIEMIGDDRSRIEPKILAIADRLDLHTFESRSYLAMILGTVD